MNVSLTPELEKLVAQKVSSGLYKSASEVVRESLRLLHERDELRELRRLRLGELVSRGLADLDVDESEVLDRRLAEDVKRIGRGRV